ncbi:MAG: hypothetical protein IJ737_07605 [Ruminococcus sp.]|nr:hypothetical protein [Ruminococcus sp.]
MKNEFGKRIAAGVMALTMCFAFAGCGSKSADDVTDKDIEQAAKELEKEETKPAAPQAEDAPVTTEAEPEPVEYDPFDYINIKYDGIAPYGKVKLSVDNPSDKPYVSLSFEADKQTNLNNGDVITVTANIKEKEYYIPTKTTEEFTVEGMDEYLMTLDDLPDDVREKLEQQAEDMLNSEVANWSDEMTLDEYSLLGNYLLTIKTDGDYGSGNRLFFLYDVKANVNMDDSYDYEKNPEYIYPVYIDDVYRLADGTWVFDPSDMTSAGDWISTVEDGIGFPVYLGYKDLDAFFSNEIASHTSDSDYMTNIGE